MISRAQRSSPIPQLAYQPQGDYPLDLEIFLVSELRRRVGLETLRASHRYEFSTLIGVTRGTCKQQVDFENVDCRPGTLLALKPGMAHSFGSEGGWDGWVVLFRPEFAWDAPSDVLRGDVCETLEALAVHVDLDPVEMLGMTTAVKQMQEDAGLNGSRENVHALLRHQLHALLIRIRMARERRLAQAPLRRRTGRRFKDFERLVEEKYRVWHQASAYAKQLGCSERTLTRASIEAVAMNSKTFISSRVTLEAKRLLTHTDLMVLEVAEQLGFSDPANFIKFFRRETGCTPATFRRTQSSA